MKLSVLFEDQDFGSRFINQRDVVRNLEKELLALEGDFVEAGRSADLRDFESDKDQSGGIKWIKRAINNKKRELRLEKKELKRLGELWNATRSRIGDEI